MCRSERGHPTPPCSGAAQRPRRETVQRSAEQPHLRREGAARGRCLEGAKGSSTEGDDALDDGMTDSTGSPRGRDALQGRVGEAVATRSLHDVIERSQEPRGADPEPRSEEERALGSAARTPRGRAAEDARRDPRATEPRWNARDRRAAAGAAGSTYRRPDAARHSRERAQRTERGAPRMKVPYVMARDHRTARRPRSSPSRRTRRVTRRKRGPGGRGRARRRAGAKGGPRARWPRSVGSVSGAGAPSPSSEARVSPCDPFVQTAPRAGVLGRDSRAGTFGSRTTNVVPEASVEATSTEPPWA